MDSTDFNLEQNHVYGVKFAEFCRAGGKWAYEEVSPQIYQ